MPVREMPPDLLPPITIELRDTARLIAAESDQPDTFSASVQILRPGSFDFGTFTPNIVKVDAELMGDLVANHAAGARGSKQDGSAADLPVDIDHETREAAGWITGLSIQGGNLMAAITWNALGVTLLAEDRFRFMSVMFSEDYRDPEGKKWGATLWGAAVTNYPRIKDMEQLSLSAREVGREPGPGPITTPDPTKGTDMDTMAIAKALGLGDDATEADILTAAEALKAAEDAVPDDTETIALKAEITGLKASMTAMEERTEASEAKAAALQADAVIERHKAAGRLTDAHLLDDDKPTDLMARALADPDAFDAMVAKWPVIVEFGTRGTAGGAGEGTPQGRLEAAIDAEIAAGAVGYAEAVAAVKVKQPALVAAAYPVPSTV